MKNKEGSILGAIYTVFLLELFAVFVVLKLRGMIDLAWVWVFAPLWAIPAAFIAFIAVVWIIYTVYLLVQRNKRQKAIKKLKGRLERGEYENQA